MRAREKCRKLTASTRSMKPGCELRLGPVEASPHEGTALLVLEDDADALDEVLETVRAEGFDAFGVSTVHELRAMASEQ